MDHSLGKRQFKDSSFINSVIKKPKHYHNTRKNYSSIICSFDYTLFISNNLVFSFGYNLYGANGNIIKDDYSLKQISGLKNIKMISCGFYHSICLDNNGIVYSFGKNNKGQLGILKDKEDFEYTNIPQKVILPRIKQVSTGKNFTICVSEDGFLYSFGHNNLGQLGISENNYSSYPQLIPYINNVDFLECGGYHCICKTFNNRFYSWGYGFSGQLGNGFNNDYNIPSECFNWPDNIISIKCGEYHSLLLTSEGQVYSFGCNAEGQLGLLSSNIRSKNIPKLINTLPKIKRIECGSNHSMGIDNDSNLWVFGYNNSGQLGLGDIKDRYKPILHPTLRNIIDISSGGEHTFVKTLDNKIFAFGNNEYLQLGIKTSEENQLTPIQVFIEEI